MSQLGIEMTPGQQQKKSRLGSIIAVILAFVVVGALLGGVLVLALNLINTSSPDEYAGPGTGAVEVRIVKGQTSEQIGATLQANGVIRDASSFTAMGDERLRQIQPGTYRLKKRMTSAGALELLLDPTAKVSVRVVIPEGSSLKKTLAALSTRGKIDSEDLAAAVADPSNLGLPAYAHGKVEGFLFPATYDVDPSTTAEDQLQAMVTRWKQAARESDLVAASKKAKLTPYEVLTVASLLEAEAQPKDFAKVARVIYNRLDKGMPLQLDTTVLYALGRTGTHLSPDELQTDSPYNTYKNKGLPPTPINSPGQQAINAALHPAKGNWLYYVTTNLKTGETKFTDSYQQFLKFKREFKGNS